MVECQAAARRERARPRPLDHIEHFCRPRRHVAVGEPQRHEASADRLRIAPSIAVEVSYPGVPPTPVELQNDSFLGQVSIDATAAAVKPREGGLRKHDRTALESSDDAIGAPLEFARRRNESLGAPFGNQSTHDPQACPTGVVIERESLLEIRDGESLCQQQVVDGALEAIDGDPRRDVEQGLCRRGDPESIQRRHRR